MQQYTMCWAQINICAICVATIFIYLFFKYQYLCCSYCDHFLQLLNVLLLFLLPLPTFHTVFVFCVCVFIIILYLIHKMYVCIYIYMYVYGMTKYGLESVIYTTYLQCIRPPNFTT